MKRTTDPTYRQAIAILRKLRRWNQKELAAALGVSADVAYALESGRSKLEPRDRERAVHVMGYRPSTFDRAVAFVELAWADLAALGEPQSSEEALAHQLDVLAAAAGQANADFMRNSMTQFLRAAETLETRRQAPGLVARLLRRTKGERTALLEELGEFGTWGVVEELCRRSELEAADSADRAVELAELAVEVAGFVPGPAAWRSRVEGYAYAFLGNARRVHGHLPAAEEAFVQHGRLWRVGAAYEDGPLDSARVVDLEASLRRAQRQFPQALSLLDQALESCPGSKARGRLLILRAKTLEESGDYEGSVATLREAVPLIEGSGDTRLLWSLRFNLVENLFQVGQHQEAADMLPQVRALASQFGNGLGILRLRWLEGRNSIALGQPEEAVPALAETRHEFITRDIPWDAALVTLQLAAVLADLSRTGEVEALAREIAPIFRAQRIEREALATLQLFLRAVETKTLTSALAWQLAADFERAGQPAAGKSEASAPPQSRPTGRDRKTAPGQARRKGPARPKP